MSTVYIDKPTPEMMKLARTHFGYRGKAYSVRLSVEYLLENYWSDGSIKVCRLISRENLEVFVPSSETGNPFRAAAHQRFTIPSGYFIIEHSISRGKDRGITFVVRPDEADTMMLPEAVDTSEDVKIVLIFTAALKSTYNGISNYRFHEANRANGISPDRWESAKKICIEQGLLDKRGAITAAGRNALPSITERQSFMIRKH